MSGVVIISMTGHDRRTEWWVDVFDWDNFQDWALVFPTRGQVTLAPEIYSVLLEDFCDITTLEDLAAKLATRTGAAGEVLDDGAVGALLAEADPAAPAAAIRSSVWQLAAWQRAGLLTADAVRGRLGDSAGSLDAVLQRIAAAESRAAERLGVIGLPTCPWAAAMAARRIVEADLDAATLELTNLYLDTFHTLSPVEVDLLNAVAQRVDVKVRFRQTPDAWRSWQPAKAMIEAMTAGDHDWDYHDDGPTDDWQERQKIAQALFPDPDLAAPSLDKGELVRWRRFESVEAELKGIAQLVTKLVEAQEGAAHILVALPEDDRYLELARQALGTVPGNPRFVLPAAAPVGPLHDRVEALLRDAASSAGPLPGDPPMVLTGAEAASWAESLLGSGLSESETYWLQACSTPLRNSTALAAAVPQPTATRLAQLKGLMAATPMMDASGDVRIVTHGEMSLVNTGHVILAGLDANGLVDRHGGWRRESLEMMAPYLLDAIDGTINVLWTSSVAGGDEISAALRRAFGGLMDWFPGG